MILCCHHTLRWVMRSLHSKCKRWRYWASSLSHRAPRFRVTCLEDNNLMFRFFADAGQDQGRPVESYRFKRQQPRNHHDHDGPKKEELCEVTTLLARNGDVDQTDATNLGVGLALLTQHIDSKRFLSKLPITSIKSTFWFQARIAYRPTITCLMTISFLNDSRPCTTNICPTWKRSLTAKVILMRR